MREAQVPTSCMFFLREPPGSGNYRLHGMCQRAENGIMYMSGARSPQGKAMPVAEGKGGKMSARERGREWFRSEKSRGGFDLRLCSLPPCLPPLAQTKARGGFEGKRAQG